MLDLVAFREHDGGQPEDVRESQRRRRADAGLVDAVIAADARWRARRHDALAHSKELAQAKAAMKPPPKAKANVVGDAAAPPAVAGGDGAQPPPQQQKPSREALAALSRAVADATNAERERGLSSRRCSSAWATSCTRTRPS